MLAGEGGMSLSVLVLPRRCRWDQNGPAAGAGESQGFILASPVPSGLSVSCGRSWRVAAQRFSLASPVPYGTRTVLRPELASLRVSSLPRQCRRDLPCPAAGAGESQRSILVLPRRCRWDQNGPAAGAGES